MRPRRRKNAFEEEEENKKKTDQKCASLSDDFEPKMRPLSV